MLRDSSRSRIVLTVLMAVSLVLLVLDSRPQGNPVTAVARSGAEIVFVPVAAGVSWVAAPLARGYQAVSAAPRAAERIAELERRNTELAAQLQARDLDEARAEQLSQLLDLSGTEGYEIIPAQAVTRGTPRGYADLMTLDVGSTSGVRANMTVISGAGLVGRVIEAGPRTSTVLLITDAASAVGARLAGSRKIGVVDGTGGSVGSTPGLRLELLDMESQVEEGERVVSLGSHEDTPFVAGVPIGTVVSVQSSPGSLSRTARIRPAVDFGALDIVGVVVSGPAGPREPVLPDRAGSSDPREPEDTDDHDEPHGLEEET